MSRRLSRAGISQAVFDRKQHTDSDSRSRVSFWCFWLSVGAAVSMLLFWALPTSNSRADQHRATELAKVRQDVRAEVGVVVARGPYAGAYADVSYREATVRYRGWNGENVELHRMVGALDSRAEFGRSVQVHVTRVGPDYLPIESEYSRPAADPYNPKIDAGQGGRWVGCIFLALVMIVGGTSLSYGAWLLWKLPSVTETPIAT